jgi:hypothetical protein
VGEMKNIYKILVEKPEGKKVDNVLTNATLFARGLEKV